MNKRLDELANQVHGTPATNQEVEFAKLIISDCVSMIDNHNRFLTDAALIKKIRDHFGVKE